MLFQHHLEGADERLVKMSEFGGNVSTGLEAEGREEKLDAGVEILNCEGYIDNLANSFAAAFVFHFGSPFISKELFPSC